ncbi:MAG: (d)CMP kinase [Anaerofustis stercorihominis]|nr:(d)CMP kinase [Anaerofustis stercorihominis]
MKNIHIAIDGPAGAGKSTIAKILADKLGIIYLDTGAMYRAVAYCAKMNGVSCDDNDALAKIFTDFNLEFSDGGRKLALNGEDISAFIRTPEIDVLVGGAASNPFVRSHLVNMQREIAKGVGVVMEGRDIGTVVLKDTPYKFYLDASVDVRANRRYLQNRERGIESDLEAIKNDIIRRDHLDSTRETDPLTKADDAIYIDSSLLTTDEAVELMLEKINGITKRLEENV